MKIRIGFVSNSSSESFHIPLKRLTALQYKFIKEINNNEEYDGSWSIYEENDMFEFYTPMNNFDMSEFLIENGIPKKSIIWKNN